MTKKYVPTKENFWKWKIPEAEPAKEHRGWAWQMKSQHCARSLRGRGGVGRRRLARRQRRRINFAGKSRIRGRGSQASCPKTTTTNKLCGKSRIWEIQNWLHLIFSPCLPQAEKKSWEPRSHTHTHAKHATFYTITRMQRRRAIDRAMITTTQHMQYFAKSFVAALR